MALYARGEWATTKWDAFQIVIFKRTILSRIHEPKVNLKKREYKIQDKTRKRVGVAKISRVLKTIRFS